MCFCYIHSATVGNLQAKVESLTTTNALMKEDLAIAKNNILGLMEENANLKAELSDSIHHERTDEVCMVNAGKYCLEYFCITCLCKSVKACHYLHFFN